MTTFEEKVNAFCNCVFDFLTQHYTNHADFFQLQAGTNDHAIHIIYELVCFGGQVIPYKLLLVSFVFVHFL